MGLLSDITLGIFLALALISAWSLSITSTLQILALERLDIKLLLMIPMIGFWFVSVVGTLALIFATIWQYRNRKSRALKAL